MNPGNEPAPGVHPGAGGDHVGARSLSSVKATGDTFGDHDSQLLGALLRATTAAEVHAMVYAVPAEAFEHRLDQGIWRAGQALADNGIADPARLVQTVVAAGLWPRDLHHEVTVRVIEAIEAARFDPHEWQTPAVDVLTAYARRVTASKLSMVAVVMPSATPREIGRQLFAAAEFAETVVHWIDHVVQPPQVVAA